MIKKILFWLVLLTIAVPAIFYALAYSALYIESIPISEKKVINMSIKENDSKQQAQVYTRYPHLWLSEQFGFNQRDEEEFALQAKKFPQGYFIEGMTHKKQIALSFDDGPSEYSLKIAEQLAKHDILATFFWMGDMVNKSPEIAKQIADKGHAIGNHTLSHHRNGKRDPEELWETSLSPTNEAIEKAIGKKPVLFRPSYGDISDAQVEFINNKGMIVANWSIDTRDWNENYVDANNISERVIDHQHREAIVLMHDAGGDRTSTVDSLDKIIEHYKAQGFEFVTIDKLLEL